ncbi:MAG: CRTAC1 family protein [Rhodothermales bacterium]
MRFIIFALFCCTFTACTSDAPTTSTHTSATTDISLFRDITEAAGIADFRHTNGGTGEMRMPEIMGAGGAFIDYNDDGWADLLLVSGDNFSDQPATDIPTAKRPAVRLYENTGGSFKNVTDDAFLNDVSAYGYGLAAADYDNDGDQDFLLTTLENNLLFKNEAGVFQEVGQQTGIGSANSWSTSAVFFDADKDGHVDLYIANYLTWQLDSDIPCGEADKRDYCNPRNYSGAADHFYRNNGNGTFTDRTNEAGFGSLAGKGLGVSVLDFNDDTWPDLFVANDGEANFLFQNNGDGTFGEVGYTSGIALDQNGTPRAGMGVDSGVVDSTGRPTIFVGNFSAEMVGVWHIDAQNMFTDRAAQSRIGFPSLNTLTFGLILFDADQDTDLDLLLANGHVMKYISEKQLGVTFKQPPQFFLNTGDGTFAAYNATAGPLAHPMVGRGLATADIDRDGDLDVLITENNGPAYIWRNDQVSNNYLRLHLQGSISNRDGLGARVRATVNDLVMERWIRSGSSYLSQSELVATFGLGSHVEVSHLEIVWPSGEIDRFENVKANQDVRVIEGSSLLSPVIIN